MSKPLILNVKVVLINNGRVLLLERNKKWTIPGGKYEAEDNSIEDTIRREVEEETAITDVEIGDIQTALVNDAKDRVLIFYKAFTQRTNVKLDDDHPSFKWVSFNEVMDVEYEYPALANIILNTTAS